MLGREDKVNYPLGPLPHLPGLHQILSSCVPVFSHGEADSTVFPGVGKIQVFIGVQLTDP